jgi:hypothetical protein
MADNKTKRFAPAAAHAVVYSLPFLLLRPSVAAFLVIMATHFLIDRYRLARFVVQFKNVVLQPAFWGFTPFWRKGYRRDLFAIHNTATGYLSDKPAWLAVWLLIAADNTLHLTLNYLALSYL